MESRELMALGIFAGAQLLVVLFSILVANAYRELSLLLHAAAGVVGLLILFLLQMPRTEVAELFPATAMLVLLALSGGALRNALKHVGGLRSGRRWLARVCLVLPAIALGAHLVGIHLLLPVAAGAVVLVVLLMRRAWSQSLPWAWWLVIGQIGMLGAMLRLGLYRPDELWDPPLLFAGALTLWSASTYLALVWRSRVFGETLARIDARNVTDPLTGLYTPLILVDRIEAARALMRRYGHPSALLLVQIENLPRLIDEFGPEAAESTVLVAASRIRQALGPSDVAARLSHARIAVLAEGVAVGQGTADVATRILVAGLKEPLPHALTEFLQFRIAVAAVPLGPLSGRAVLERMGDLLEAQTREASDRRILTIGVDELELAETPLSAESA